MLKDVLALPPYDAMTDARDIAADLNIVDIPREHETIDGATLFNVIDGDEYNNLPTLFSSIKQKIVDQLIDTVNQTGSINVAPGGRSRMTIETIGPKTAIAFSTALGYMISRAEDAGIRGKVKVGHVQRARGFRSPLPLSTDYRKEAV